MIEKDNKRRDDKDNEDSYSLEKMKERKIMTKKEDCKIIEEKIER